MTKVCVDVRLGVAAAVLISGCFSEPDTPMQSAGSSGSSTSAASTSVGSVGSTSLGSTGSSGQSTSAATGASTSSSSGDSQPTTEGETSDSADTGSTTSSGLGIVCPSFSDTFDEEGVYSGWISEWGQAIEQLGGETVFMLTPVAGDQYPRRLLPWEALGEPPPASLTVRMQPSAVPTEAGTQLNLLIEGGPGEAVTFSLNRTQDELEYRVSVASGGKSTTVASDGVAAFPEGGWLQLVATGNTVTFEVTDPDDNVVSTIAADVKIPFPPQGRRFGFGANNWAPLDEPAQLAVNGFAIRCE